MYTTSKSLYDRSLEKGNLAIIPVYASYFSHLTTEDLWILDNYNPTFTDII